MRRIGALLGVLLLAVGCPAFADDAGEAAQTYRHSIFQTIRWNFMPLSEMARGKREFDAAEAKRRALAVAYLATLLDEAFPAGSGASAGTTDALDVIWQDPDDFAARLKAFQVEANQLRKIATHGDAAAFNEQFRKVGGTCKNCHDKYKAD
jgi:cytochrome c556